MKILVRATNWVGDAVMSIPALEAIRRRWPQAEIVLLARPWVADLYRGQGLADRLEGIDGVAGAGGFAAMERTAARLRTERFDAAVLLPNSFAAAWLAWRAGAAERVGYARDGRSWLLTRAIPVPRPGETHPHEAYYYLELLRRAGWIDHISPVEEIRLRVEPAAASRALESLDRAAEACGAAGGGSRRIRIAVAAGAAYGSAKCWPAERYAQLADRLIAEFGVDVILFGAVTERDVARRVAAAMQRRAVNLAGQTPIGELPALLAGCDLFIGNDSGAMHVAAAVGLPVVALFGPTDPDGTGPITPKWTRVQQRVACSPCFLRHCPVDHRCMTRVGVEAVHSAVREWVQEGKGNCAQG